MNKWWFKVTRLIPDAKGTTCNQRLERISGTEHTNILRVPFRNENGILRKWISRFDVWPYLETFAEVGTKRCYICFFVLFVSLFLPTGVAKSELGLHTFDAVGFLVMNSIT